MEGKRIYIEKREGFQTESESLRHELNSNLQLNIKKLRLITIYDLFGMSEELLEKTGFKVFAEPATDDLLRELDTTGMKFLATEYLPGQFDQRASSAEDCVKLIQPDANINIRSGRLMIFEGDLSESDLKKISDYCINPVESREKDLSILKAPTDAEPASEQVLTGFRKISRGKAEKYCSEHGLAMNGDDLMEVVKYFQKEGRDPNRTELKILDTYWSDHCRHTTFTTELKNIRIEPSKYSDEIRKTIGLWLKMRSNLGREGKPLCLMDLATIGARYLKKKGILDNLEESEENNACSILIDVDVDGKEEKWLLQFKNETHNHPTEIEPFGGASTCLGGAVRDPLSGRSYVYQAMRVTGAGDIYAPIEKTLKGKLPQRVISLRAASGYSSYGNQLGLATTHVREIYHPGYIAKRMEVGAVVGAVKADHVRRERPEAGDVILMLGGRTGRDGIGGATGSSKQHSEQSLEECGSEVQKGNPPEERKLQRLFRRPEVTRLIKKSNDFGAGGISVAIGELADGLDIYLDRIKTKYSGLSATDLAISESQERMAVVVEKKDKEKFEGFCKEENIEVTHVADVTDTARMRMYLNGEKIADLSRDFIDSAGAPHKASVIIEAPEVKTPFDAVPKGKTLREKIMNLLKEDNITSQKGLVEMFDSTIGASTVLMPFGGKTQTTESQVSVQKLPVGNHTTNTASMMSFGYNPDLTTWSPYHGAVYAIVEAVAKAVAAGADYTKMRFSYQEYFERMSSHTSWGKPLSALLGALLIQMELGLPAIGGKDSMSGTFGDLNVPPTLIAFGVAPVDARDVISPEFKKGGDRIYLLKMPQTSHRLPDINFLKEAYKDLHSRIKEKKVTAAYALGFGGVVEAIAKMSFGNGVGAEVHLEEKDLFNLNSGSIVIESEEVLPASIYTRIGETLFEDRVIINGEKFTVDELREQNRCRFAEVYKDRGESSGAAENSSSGECKIEWKGEKTDHPRVYLPVFPGTNCDYDMAEAFRREGAETEFGVFRNLTAKDIEESVEEMSRAIDQCHILALSGGFSAGDEPDGSGKFIATVLQNEKIKNSVEGLLKRGGLILGICNGFQALIKSGLLPYGKIGELDSNSPTLTKNNINRHISQMVTTRVSSIASPWLSGFEIGEEFTIAASHGEGKFTANPELVEKLAKNGQIAFQYVGPDGKATMESPFNPNGSTDAIEGIISPDGQILGKMAHSERYKEGLMKNISGNKNQNIFKNAINYFKK